MLQKKIDYRITGMSRDNDVNSLDTTNAYEIHNLRVTPIDDNNNLLALVSEQKEEPLSLDTPIEGAICGYAVINDYLILFCYNNETNTIYKIDLSKKVDDKYKVTRIASDVDLNIRPKYNLETLPYYENEDIQKVYWTDSVNPPRVININKSYSNPKIDEFDFIQNSAERFSTMCDISNIDIKKLNTGGTFKPGVIQYFFTLVTPFIRESAILYTSPRYYITNSNRGGNPEETCSNSFKIHIPFKVPSRSDSYTDLIRIYSVQYTTLNGTPECRLVTTEKIVRNGNEHYIDFTDTGLYGEIVDYTSLFTKGGDKLVAQTIEQKNNTLFLGNIETDKSFSFTPTMIEKIKANIEILSDLKNVNNRINTPSGVFYDYVFTLDRPSYKVCGFKYREEYRLGVQFQHQTGKWSDTIWLGDEVMLKAPTKGNMPIFKMTFVSPEEDSTDSYIVDDLKALCYINIRPVVVFPSVYERNILCQAITAPTVYNVDNRIQDSGIWAQSSWFFRSDGNENDSDESPQKGHVPEWRHNKLLNYTEPYKCEIKTMACLKKASSFDLLSKYDKFPIEQPQKGWGCFAIDRSIITLHSPELEYDEAIQNIDLNEYKIMPIGGICCSANNSDIYISTKNVNRAAANGFERVIVQNATSSGYGKHRIGSFSWWDKNWVNNKVGTKYRTYLIHPWHSTGSLTGNNSSDTEYSVLNKKIISNSLYSGNTFYFDFNNDTNDYSIIPEDLLLYNSNEATTINIKYNGDRKMYAGNIDTLVSGYSTNTVVSQCVDYKKDLEYYPYILGKADTDSDSAITLSVIKNSEGISNKFISLFLNGTNEIVKFYTSVSMMEGYFPIITPLGSNVVIKKITYNDDQVFICDNNNWNIGITRSNINTFVDYVWSIDTREYLLSVDYTKKIKFYIEYETVGFDLEIQVSVPLMMPPSAVSSTNSFCYTLYNPDNNSNIVHSNDLTANYNVIVGTVYTIRNNNKDINIYTKLSPSPVQMKYKSTPHYVASLPTTNIQDNKTQLILPGISTYNTSIVTEKPFFTNNITQYKSFILPSIPSEGSSREGAEGTALLVDIVRKNPIDKKFGGDSESALANNQWVPCGPAVKLEGSPIIECTEGDTYFQRYDLLKTYPFTEEDENQMVEIVSYLTETRCNIDGRYDRNRGLESNLYTRPTNFNLFNPVYNQKNNLFTYGGNVTKDADTLVINKFPNRITWTLPKQSGSIVDNWTNVTNINGIDLEGDKGEITNISKISDELVAFQNHGIARVLYNEQAAITTTNGMPLELANSNKVSGYKYLTDTVGCTNKKTIVKGGHVLYFKDDNTKGIYSLNSQMALDNLTQNHGFNSWIKENANEEDWHAGYDEVNKELLFIRKYETLAYNELIGKFTSFYSYDPKFVVSIKDKTLFLKDNTVSLRHGSDELLTPSLTIFSTLGSQFNTLYTNLEYVTDNNEVPMFDTVEVETVAQKSEKQPLNNINKFNVWRSDLPREYNSRHRMQGTWSKIKLTSNNTIKHKLHNLSVIAYI